ncbi:helix-turn-helix domain-containing protein [Aeromicrobium sp. Root495]|uniref:helix-turn-helix domain-containing protein n=1 Tax=Aeromicrobium sp. Root495 TaxID=1736550 RepID=UPI00138F43B7|nr:helix-turn-helix domain-containing protein [Aeromicrobium sp. Root495]
MKVETEFLRVNDVSEMLGLNRRTVYSIIARDELKATKLGGQWFIRSSDVTALMGGA